MPQFELIQTAKDYLRSWKKLINVMQLTEMIELWSAVLWSTQSVLYDTIKEGKQNQVRAPRVNLSG